MTPQKWVPPRSASTSTARSSRASPAATIAGSELVTSVAFDTFFKALGRIGYDGPIVFESFSSAVVAPDLSRMLGIWRNLWTDNVELGAHANAFIRDKLIAVDSIRLH